MIKRRAAPEWRWARAISPGITIWMLATSVLLADTRTVRGGQAQHPALGLLGTKGSARPHRHGRRSKMPQVGHRLALRLDADAAAIEPASRVARNCA
jgi:hypothetical protein